MSGLQDLIETVERAVSQFVEPGHRGSDPALARLRAQEEELLSELRGLRSRRVSHGILATLGGLGALGSLGLCALTAWAAVPVVLLVAGVVLAAHQSVRVAQLGERLVGLRGRHERLLGERERRRALLARLESPGRAEQLVLALDGLDGRVAPSAAGARELRQGIRDKVVALKREVLLPLLDARERTARFVREQDRDGLAQEVEELLLRVAEREATVDYEGKKLLERNLKAKQDVLDRVDQALRELETTDLRLETVESLLAQAEAVLTGGAPRREEVLRVFDEMREGLTPLGAAAQSERLGGGARSALPPASGDGRGA